MEIKMQKEAEDKTVGEAFEEFLKYCKVKSLSESTIEYYKTSYNYFIKFYSEDHLTKNITRETVNDFILHLKERDMSNTSVNSRLRGLRAILYYFMKLGYTKEFKIEMIKSEKKIKKTYSDEELELLLEKPDLDECSFAQYRNWVIVNYLLGTGNRLKTLINVKIKDVDFDSGYVTLKKTKNKKQQVIPLSKQLSKILMEYLEYREGEPEDYLFCNIYGKKLKESTTKSAIRKYNLKRGVDKTSIHLFRHTFAKKWILAGGDVFRLQKILGHSTMDVVKEYVNMFGNDLKKEFDKFNPLDQVADNYDPIEMK
ncbi:tyrosine recombinase XerC [Halanaerocella petrolearia]